MMVWPIWWPWVSMKAWMAALQLVPAVPCSGLEVAASAAPPASLKRATIPTNTSRAFAGHIEVSESGALLASSTAPTGGKWLLSIRYEGSNFSAILAQKGVVLTTF